MMERNASKLIAIILLMFSSLLFAQEKLSLSVDQAVEVGIKNSKILHSSLMKVKLAEARVKEINAGRLPALKLNAAYRRLSEITPFSISFSGNNYTISPSILDNYTTTLSVYQPVFTGFRLASSTNMAEQSTNATTEEYNRDQSELVFNIKNAYWSLFKAMQMKNVLDETVAQAKAHISDAQNLYKAGMLTENDILKLQVQLSDIEFRQADAENMVKIAKVALNNVLSISLNTEIEINSIPNRATLEYDELDKLVEMAIQKRPEIKSADYRIKASEAGVTMAQSSWYPQVSIVGNFYYSRPNSRIFPTTDEFRDTWDAGVNVSVNIWDWLTTSHQTDQAKAQLSQSEDAFGIIKDNISLEVTQNYLNFNQAKRKIEISELGVKQAEENLRVTEDKFRTGMALSSDVIDAETASTTAKVNYTNSIVDYELAIAKLDKSIGK
jgi:outer membrane protein TolC